MKRLVVAIAAVAIGTMAFGETLHWDPRGSGGWGSATRYLENREPQAGDIVDVGAGASAPLTDDDWSAVQGLSRIYMSDATSRVILDLSGDYAWNGQVYGQGTFVKLGRGMFTVKGTVSFFGCLAVTNGVLSVEKIVDTLSSRAWPVVSVAAGATFTIAGTAHGATTFLAGLCGEGTVSNLNVAAGLQIMGPRDATDNPPEYVFDGQICGIANFGFGAGGGSAGDYARYGGPCRQRITQAQPDLKVRNGLKIGSGDIYIPTIGDGNDTNPGALGNGFWNASELGSTLCFTGYTNLTATVRYTGTGELVRWREFAFLNSFLGSEVSIDAGAATTLEFANAWRYDPEKFGLRDGVMGHVVLDGSNTSACVVSGTFAEKDDDVGFSFIKRGSGVWRFTDKARENRGPILVERGTLEFDSIAEAGIPSALGTASVLSTNFWGAAESCLVPWAFRLGDGSTDWMSPGLATLRYSGPTGNVAASCATRPIAIRGAARIADADGGSIHLTGAFSDQPGVNALVLGGSGDDSLVNVTNGTGTLRIVKEGKGSWTLGGDLDFSGGIDVRSGTLRLASASDRYTWYRFSVKELNYDYKQYPTWGSYVSPRQIALWNENGLVNENLTHDLDADGNPISIDVGEYAIVRRNWHGTDAAVTRDEDSVKTYNLFTTVDTGVHIGIGGVKPTLGDPSSWIGVVMRPTTAGSSATRYDLRAWSNGFANNARSWTMEGSPDGLVWTELHSVVSNDNVFSASKCWYTATNYDGSWNAASVPGYELPTTAASAPRRAASLGAISVAAGARILADSEQSVDAISCDASLGCGKIQGVAFAQTGALTVVGGAWANGRMVLGYEFADCSGLENISNWSVNVDGRRGNCSVKVTDDGIVLTKNGLVIVVQ